MRTKENIESAVNAYNTNAQRRNIAEANSAQRVQAKAQKDQYDQQRKGRLKNAG
jgi:cation transport regulator ChaB